MESELFAPDRAQKRYDNYVYRTLMIGVQMSCSRCCYGIKISHWVPPFADNILVL